MNITNIPYIPVLTMEMNALLLKKIEELTLHLIAQQKEIEELKQVFTTK